MAAVVPKCDMDWEKMYKFKRNQSWDHRCMFQPLNSCSGSTEQKRKRNKSYNANGLATT